MARLRKKIGEILVEQRAVSAEQIEQALVHAKKAGKRLGEALVELEMCAEEVVYRALAAQFGMEYVELTKSVISGTAIAMVPEKIIKRFEVLPVSNDNGKLKVAIWDPTNLDAIDTLHFQCGLANIQPVLSPRSRIRILIDAKFNSADASLDELSRSLDASVDHSLDRDAAGGKKKTAEDPDAPIIKLINMVISEAVRGRASDIHVEPMNDRVRVRYRIDGVCVERENIPKRMQGAVTTRLKIMSGMDIAEKRVPLDGRIKLNVAGSDIDFRVASCPGVHGESIVLRILRPDNVKIGLGKLGFAQDDYETFQRIIRRPNGIFLVTGPTGSGKTTTLYAALQELNRPDRKIITAEDPVEYNFAGINQCQVKDDIGLTFDKILRSMLRQAPNIILVGEIRDVAVGEIAIQAALTGHLVFSTLHTNDAPSAITRLIDLGIKPFLVASAVQAIMAQRLVRVICEECKMVDPTPDPYTLRLIGLTPEKIGDKPLYKGRGCTRCNNTGYRGRKGIFEILGMNSELRELAFKRAPTNQLKKAALASGMRTLLEDGQRKVLTGMTTADEIMRTTQVEGLVESDEESGKSGAAA
ncbi:MAG: ATPase, T2SS/T4P/T4SS family [Phycisphaerae bacterium]